MARWLPSTYHVLLPPQHHAQNHLRFCWVRIPLLLLCCVTSRAGRTSLDSFHRLSSFPNDSAAALSAVKMQTAFPAVAMLPTQWEACASS